MSLVIPLEKEGCQKRNGPSLGPFFVGGVAGAGDGQLPGPKRAFLHRIKSRQIRRRQVWDKREQLLFLGWTELVLGMATWIVCGIDAAQVIRGQEVGN